MKTISQIDLAIDKALAKLNLTKRQTTLAKAFINLNRCMNDNNICPVDTDSITFLVSPNIALKLRECLGEGLFGSDDEFKGFGFEFEVKDKSRH